jgi:CubicO group peptidase (beta-lactamase class C family)
MHVVCSRRAFLRSSLGLIAASSLARGAEQPPKSEPTSADISGHLDAIFGNTKVPGAAALALHGDQIVAQGVTGVRRKGADARIALTDKFHLGSCTKAMTATLVGLFIDEGKLTWSTTLAELFDDVKDAHPAWKKVTVRHVLAHRAGLPPNIGPQLRNRLASSPMPLMQQRRLVVAELLAKPPESEPGSKFVYANNGFTLLGAALEKISGRPWEELMRTRLFEPLGIASGGFGAPGRAGILDQPRGHGPAGVGIEPGPRADNIAAMGPAGTAHMTIADWAKFAALHLRGDPANPERAVKLLSADSFQQLHRPAPGETYIGGWGTGTRPWARGSRPSHTGLTLSHSGSNTMWFCVVWLAPEIDFAALVACNAAGEGVGALCDKAVGELIRQYAPKPGASE